MKSSFITAFSIYSSYFWLILDFVWSETYKCGKYAKKKEERKQEVANILIFHMAFRWTKSDTHTVLL